MATIFISHSSQDRPFAQKLSGDLQLIGQTPWIDHVDTGTHISGLLVVHSESGLRQHQRSTIDFVPQKSGHQGAVSNAVTIA